MKTLDKPDKPKIHNPIAVSARLRTSAGPMKTGKKRLHKEIRHKSKRTIMEELLELEGGYKTV